MSYINVYKATFQDCSIVVAIDGNKSDIAKASGLSKYKTNQLFKANATESEARIACRHMGKAVVKNGLCFNEMDLSKLDEFILASNETDDYLPRSGTFANRGLLAKAVSNYE